MSSVYDLSWNKNSFLNKFDLFTKAIDDNAQLVCSMHAIKRSDGYSALSSVYYSIAGSTFAKLKSLLKPCWRLIFLPVSFSLFLITWLPLGVWCYFRMLPLSNKALYYAGGYDNFSADKCDVRQSILRKRGLFYEAEHCIWKGLSKKESSLHTKALLFLGLSYLYMRVGEVRSAEEYTRSALKFIKEIKEYDPRQAIRVYKGCAQIADVLGMVAPNGNTLRRQAKELAESIGAKDQSLKMEVS